MPSIRQSVSASVAHRYWNDQWGVDKNQKTYGIDASSEGVGSNLLLEVEAHGRCEDVTAGLAHIKALVDHQSLFTSRPSTLETITQWLAKELFAKPGEWHSLHVQETDQVGCTAFVHGAFELKIHVLNLILGLRSAVDAESGLIANRHQVQEVVRELFFAHQAASEPKTWSQALFNDLKKALPALHSLHIDLGRQEYLCLPESV